MASIVVQPVDAACAAMEISSLGPTACVIDLKEVILTRTGAPHALQRLVFRGRILLDSENLEAAGIAGGGRVFLALLSRPGTAMAAEGEVDGLRRNPHNDIDNAESDADTFVEIFVRPVDSEEEVRVLARPSALALDFKRAALQRLCWPASPEDVDCCRFVCNGQLLTSDDPLAELGVCAGAHVVVVPPRAPGSVARSRRGCCQCRSLRLSDLLLCLHQLRLYLYFVWKLPKYMWCWLLTTWYDPWSLVRPSISEEERRGRRIQTLGFHQHRNLRFAPGQNPHGEDLTMLFSQGILGGG